MPETFQADEYEDEQDQDQQDQDEDERPSGYRRPPPRRGQTVPDAPVENADDLPLLTHAGTGKANTVSYLKVIRLDGSRGVRGIKGQLPPDSTVETVARRFGNGTYKIEGCNYRHKVLAREENLEVSIPGFDEDERGPVAAPQQGGNPSFTLHSMKMIADMAGRHHDSIKETSVSAAEQVREMNTRTMEMLTAFTTATRESERVTQAAAASNQQQFFATMMAMMSQSHKQQMELLMASHERSRKSEVDPMALVKLFIEGMKHGGEMGNDPPAEWLQALREGSGMLGSLASLANAPSAKALAERGNPRLPAAPSRQLPSARTRAPRPAAEPNAAPAAEPNSAPVKRKGRLPFNRDELRGIARLRAELRRRDIPFGAFLEQTTDFYQKAPDSELFEAGDDGPVESEHDAAEIPDSASQEASEADA